jgi:hypothetical protein
MNHYNCRLTNTLYSRCASSPKLRQTFGGQKRELRAYCFPIAAKGSRNLNRGSFAFLRFADISVAQLPSHVVEGDGHPRREPPRGGQQPCHSVRADVRTLPTTEVPKASIAPTSRWNNRRMSSPSKIESFLSPETFHPYLPYTHHNGSGVAIAIIVNVDRRWRKPARSVTGLETSGMRVNIPTMVVCALRSAGVLNFPS